MRTMRTTYTVHLSAAARDAVEMALEAELQEEAWYVVRNVQKASKGQLPPGFDLTYYDGDDYLDDTIAQVRYIAAIGGALLQVKEVGR